MKKSNIFSIIFPTVIMVLMFLTLLQIYLIFQIFNLKVFCCGNGFDFSNFFFDTRDNLCIK